MLSWENVKKIAFFTLLCSHFYGLKHPTVEEGSLWFRSFKVKYFL